MHFGPIVSRIFHAITFVCATGLFAIISAAAPGKPNILFIAVDDLRPELNCYGAKHIHSPNIDALAASGRRFTRAYCQQAVCNPSRTSLMTGKRPDTIGVTGNHSHFRTKHPQVVTLPQLFKHHGYHTAAIGKIFHGVFPEGASRTKWDTMGDPPSWSVPAIRFGPRYYYTEAGIAAARRVFERIYQPQNPQPDDWTKKLVFGPACESPNVPDNVLYDGQVADAAVEKLRRLQESEQPFFLAVGFIKPHSPYIAPQKYFDLYPHVATPTAKAFPIQSPQFSGHRSSELRRYTDQPGSGPIPYKNQQRVRQAYFACVSYIDAQIGRVLGALEDYDFAHNTIIVLYGDHGYHLGEHGLWGKTTNFELDTRVPLIVRTPGMPAAGVESESLVELLDLYPTLADLAGLPLADDLQGKSLAPILENPTHNLKEFALSQYPRGELMGYSMRTSNRRLTHWVHQPSSEIRATELYEYTDGLVEKKNIADEQPQVVAQQTHLWSRAFQDSFVSAPAPRASNRTQPENDQTQQTGFEQAKPGSFKELQTQIGSWTPGAGRTVIDDKHAKTGKQCLQLMGGKQTTVTLRLDRRLDATGDLTFWAERWTKRAPFSFRIEKKAKDSDWTEIYNGDRQVRVGRPFLSHVKVPLRDKSIEQLRFTCSSPPGTGVLIDDIRLSKPAPMKIVSVKARAIQSPVLVRNDVNPVIDVQVEVTGSLNALTVTRITALQMGTASSNEGAQTVDVWATGTSATPPSGDLNMARSRAALFATDRSMRLTFDGKRKLEPGVNHFFLSVRLPETTDTSKRFSLDPVSVTINEQRISIEKESAAHHARIGVAVRKPNDDGARSYRIPGLATTNKGTLIAVYDIRRRSSRDLPGDIDVGMSRSTDGGRTWAPMKKVMDMGDDPKWNYDGIGDPAVLVDKTTGTIWVAATWSHGNRSWVGSGPGLEPHETGQLMMVRSDDDGLTWSPPINITKQVKKPEWCFLLQGPGKGITMRDGTLVFAAQYQDPPAQKRLPHATILYSKDHGATWKIGTGAFDDTTEAQVVEIEPGVLMLNCRYNRQPVRVVMTTDDMGQTWRRHSTSERAFIEPRSCMASLINVDQERGKDLGGWLLFSNPDSSSSRHRLTIKASPDGGKTWPKQHRLLLDEGRSAYSCMSMIDDKTVGILYEGSGAPMTFQRIPLADLIGPVSSASAPPSPDLDPKNPAKLAMPAVFGSHMVLQAGAELPVWGTAKPGSQVQVVLGGEQKVALANKNGEWQVRFRARSNSDQAITLRVESNGRRIEFHDVLIGEVWICAGQSNMEWPLGQSTHGRDELSTANHPQLRLLHLVGGARGSSGSYGEEHLARLSPNAFCQGEWKRANAESAREFSAVAWYFGRLLQEQLKVPVGLICPAVGGTPTEAWISRQSLQADPELKGLVAGNWLDNPQLGEFCRTRGEQNLLRAVQSGESIPGDDLGPNHSFKPGFMWSAAIEPMIPFAMRGAIWYQGESNAESFLRVRQHRRLFPMLINDWRTRWGQGSFPFVFVQLPALKRSEWPWFRDGQNRVLNRLKNVGMATTIDTGHRTNVHPSLKKPVGERLAIWALSSTYRHANYAVPTGPSALFFVGQGHGNAVYFKNVGSGLKTTDGKPPRHFEICGADGVFHKAEAKIAGNDAVEVYSPHCPAPVSARYAWSPYPDPPVNLINSVGLPAAPFTTESEKTLLVRREAATKADAIKRPNILLIVGEDHGCELSCYGDPVIQTPNIDRLAAEGVLFENGYVTQSVCSPSRSTIFTGLYPHQNGQLGLATHQYGWFKKWPTTYSLLKKNGYRTGLIGKTHVIPAAAVESFVDFRFQPSSNFAKRNVAQYAVKAGEFFRAGQQPFFMTVNYPDAHWPLQGSVDGLPKSRLDPTKVRVMPYVGGETPRLREIVQNYYDCMLRLDACVGQLLQQLEAAGKADNTLVVFIGDHGAQMARGKVTVYEGGMRVPYIVRWPGVSQAKRRSKALVSTIDLLPTFMDAARIAAPLGLPGKSLRPVCEPGEGASLREFVACERNCDSAQHTFPQRTIRDERYKLIYSPVRDREDPAARYYRVNGHKHWSGCLTDKELAGASAQTKAGYERWLNPPEFQLYDLKTDPHEWVDLADDPEHASAKRRLQEALRDWQKQTQDPISDPAKLRLLMQENQAVFKSGRRSPEKGWKYLEYLAPKKVPANSE